MFETEPDALGEDSSPTNRIQAQTINEIKANLVTNNLDPAYERTNKLLEQILEAMRAQPQVTSRANTTK